MCPTEAESIRRKKEELLSVTPWLAVEGITLSEVS